MPSGASRPACRDPSFPPLARPPIELPRPTFVLGYIKAWEFEKGKSDDVGQCSPARKALHLVTAGQLTRGQSVPSAPADLADRLSRKLVRTLVFRVASVSLDPVPADFVGLQGFIKALPELGILHRFLVGRAPVVALPAMDPGGDAVPEIGAVRIEVDDRGTLQGLERPDGCHQLHAVVGRDGLATPQLLPVRARDQNGAPAARTRISGAGS